MAGYTLFHLLATLAWCYLSIRAIDRLRSPDRVPLRPPAEEPKPTAMAPAAPEAAESAPPAEPAPVLGYRPPLTGEPMIWRELNFGQEFRLQRLHAGLLVVLFLAGFALFIIFLTIFSDSLGTGMTGERLNVLWVKPAGTSLACLMFLLIAFFAASSVTREREWETLESLLSTPLERHSILFAKWLGSLWGVRQLWWWLGGVWLIGVLTGGLNVLAVPLLLLAWTVFAVFVASLGVFLSIVCPTSQRATIAVLLICALLGVAPWLLAGSWQLMGTPPSILMTLAFSYDNANWNEIGTALVWLGCYAAAGWGLWTLSLSWFEPQRKRR
jgi:ABC-type transport system involved in multi-copper enzyme maturation permease subunit